MDNVKYRKLGEEDTKESQPESEGDEEQGDSGRLHHNNDQSRNKKTKRPPNSLCMMALKVTSVLVLLVVIGAFIIPYVMPAPLHAQCSVTWNFPSVSCPDVSGKLQNQIKKWATDENCPEGAGEKCLYKLVSVNATVLKATHMTPVKHYVDDLSFTFKPNEKMCDVKGFSTSETWYAVLDSGTNYCNLRNLIEGSALNMTTGFKETTSDDICTQYSSADCDKY